MTEQVNQSETFDQLLKKATRLKEFALKNGYSVDQTTIKELNALRQARASVDNNVPTDSWDKLDTAIASLTSVTFPTTIDTLSEEDYPPTYLRFKAWLFGIGVVALFFAVSGFVLSVKHVALQFSNSLLALCLGLLGAVVYGLFNVLRVLPPQAFNPKDEYSNYARLLLGVLVGWVFYFAFARAAFADLPTYLDKTGDVKKDWTQAFLLLIPFVAGYSTKFVVGILDRAIAALEIALGIEEKRDIAPKLVLSRRS